MITNQPIKAFKYDQNPNYLITRTNPGLIIHGIDPAKYNLSITSFNSETGRAHLAQINLANFNEDNHEFEINHHHVLFLVEKLTNHPLFVQEFLQDQVHICIIENVVLHYDNSITVFNKHLIQAFILFYQKKFPNCIIQLLDPILFRKFMGTNSTSKLSTKKASLKIKLTNPIDDQKICQIENRHQYNKSDTKIHVDCHESLQFTLYALNHLTTLTTTDTSYNNMYDLTYKTPHLKLKKPKKFPFILTTQVLVQFNSKRLLKFKITKRKLIKKALLLFKQKLKQ